MDDNALALAHMPYHGITSDHDAFGSGEPRVVGGCGPCRAKRTRQGCQRCAPPARRDFLNRVRKKTQRTSYYWNGTSELAMMASPRVTLALVALFAVPASDALLSPQQLTTHVPRRAVFFGRRSTRPCQPSPSSWPHHASSGDMSSLPRLRPPLAEPLGAGGGDDDGDVATPSTFQVTWATVAPLGFTCELGPNTFTAHALAPA